MRIDNSFFTFNEGTVESKAVQAVSENTNTEEFETVMEELSKGGFQGGGHMWMLSDSITFPSITNFSFYKKEKKHGHSSVFLTVLNRTKKYEFDIAGLRKKSEDPNFYVQHPLMGELYRASNDKDLFLLVAGKTVRCIGREKTLVPEFRDNRPTGQSVQGSLPIFELVDNENVPDNGTDWPLPNK